MRLTRRSFLGSTIGVLGGGLIEGCKQRLPRYLVPHSVPPDDAVAGLARHYRTVCRECPAACGATARVHEGRAIKLEGNPDHPISRGALCPRGQAAIEGLYSPTRLAAPRAGEKEIGWEQAAAALAEGIKHALEENRRVVVLTRPEPGKLGTFFGAWLAALGQPATQVVTFDPMERSWLREGQKQAFGTEALPITDLAGAKLLLSIGDDFVEEGSPVESARALADHRAAGGRFVYLGSRLSLTAASADQWISVEPGTELTLVLGLARQVLETVRHPIGPAPGIAEELRTRLAPFDAAAVTARTNLSAAAFGLLATSLVGARPSLVIGPGRSSAGMDAPALAEAIYVLNALLGNVGTTLRFLPSLPVPPGMGLADFIRRAAAGEVGALILHHVDPLGYGLVYDELGAVLSRIPFIATFTNEFDDTARRAHLALADHHFLEDWSDVPSRPGVVGIQQPVMTPVFGTRAAADVLLEAARALGRTSGLPDGAFGDAVRQGYSEKEVELGGHFAAAETTTTVTLSRSALTRIRAPAALRGPAGGLALVIAPTFRHLDGRKPRSALLQELPDPLSGYSWTGWVELHPVTASSLHVKSGDVVALKGPGGSIELPAHVTQAIRAGVVGVPVGDATGLLEGKALIGLGARVTVRPTGAVLPTYLPEGARQQHGRELARSVSRSKPKLPERLPQPSMYPPVEHPSHRWGMAIDLDRCTGCGACTAACYVENNIAIVGPEEVRRSRSMSWLQIQAFVEERPGGPEISFLPLGCQHCTNAPCEAVCPVFATYHSKEGLNSQVYARCIGTRYCENNCPYGVRRFNFFDWPRQASARLGLNPDVSVRERGVTEKCSLCVHRIKAAEEQAKMEGRGLRAGEIVSACAATCPSRAIVFGDLKDPGSEISRLATDGRAYQLLEELNTIPGVFYLARRREKA
jgi:Fe-S-cluster-containing dehydrogenase component